MSRAKEPRAGLLTATIFLNVLTASHSSMIRNPFGNGRRHVLLASFLVAACNGGDSPQVPAALEAISKTSIVAAVATAVSDTPAVVVRDAQGRGIANVSVRFHVTSGGGTVVNDSVRTAGNGVASAGGWTLGTASGSQMLTATAAGLAPVTFVVQAAPGAVQHLVRVSTDAQQTVVNTSVPGAPSARAVDQYDNPVPGVSVTFTALNGVGLMTGAQKTTGADGVATADSWKLGTGAGLYQARADAPGVAVPATFSAIALPDAPVNIVNVSNTTVFALANSLVTVAPSVRVIDVYDNPVPNVTVTFTIAAGSGSVTGATALTNFAGIATVGGWTLGTAGVQTLVATVASLPGRQITFNATIAPSAFTLTVRYVGTPPSARQQLAVDRAIAKWRSVIVGAVGSSRMFLSAGQCASWQPAIDEQVTDLLILARIGPIDGVGGARDVLGQAGPCVFYTASRLTAFGIMEFDEANLAQLEVDGSIDPVILHEIGHILGFGTDPWFHRSLMTDYGTADPIFNGSAALDQFALFGGAGYTGRPIPLENLGFAGDGSYGSHWRESVFQRELMSPNLDKVGPWPLSRATAAAMADIGYQVSLNGADNFTVLSGLASLWLARGPQIELGNDVLSIPAFFLDDNGRLTPTGFKGRKP